MFSHQIPYHILDSTTIVLKHISNTQIVKYLQSSFTTTIIPTLLFLIIVSALDTGLFMIFALTFDALFVHHLTSFLPFDLEVHADFEYKIV